MIPEIKIDWREINTLDEFYRVIFKQIDPPNWHGKNLNALNDSLVTGDICKSGPPFNFVILNKEMVNDKLKDTATAFQEIVTDSINENGGTITAE